MINRRQFLQMVGGTTLIIGWEGPLSALTPGVTFVPSDTVQWWRYEDLFHFQLNFYNFIRQRNRHSNQVTLSRISQDAPAFIEWIFSPQHFLEQSFHPENPPLDHQVPIFWSSDVTRLLLEIPDGISPVGYSPAQLIELIGKCKVLPSLWPAMGATNLPTINSLDDLQAAGTRLSLPAGFVLTPGGEIGATFPSSPINRNGWVELGEVALGVQAKSQNVPSLSESLASVGKGPVPLIYTNPWRILQGPQEAIANALQGISLPDGSNQDARPIIAQQAVDAEADGLQLPLQFDWLRLSALGGTFSLKGTWPDLPTGKYPVPHYEHRGALGRDSFIEIVEYFNLFPFGHRLALVRMTERDPSDESYLYSRDYLVPVKPVRSYDHATGKDGLNQGPSGESLSLARQMPLSQMTLNEEPSPPGEFIPLLNGQDIADFYLDHPGGHPKDDEVIWKRLESFSVGVFKVKGEVYDFSATCVDRSSKSSSLTGQVPAFLISNSVHYLLNHPKYVPSSSGGIAGFNALMSNVTEKRKNEPAAKSVSPKPLALAVAGAGDAEPTRNCNTALFFGQKMVFAPDGADAGYRMPPISFPGMNVSYQVPQDALSSLAIKLGESALEVLDLSSVPALASEAFQSLIPEGEAIYFPALDQATLRIPELAAIVKDGSAMPTAVMSFATQYLAKTAEQDFKDQSRLVLGLALDAAQTAIGDMDVGKIGGCLKPDVQVVGWTQATGLLSGIGDPKKALDTVFNGVVNLAKPEDSIMDILGSVLGQTKLFQMFNLTDLIKRSFDPSDFASELPKYLPEKIGSKLVYRYTFNKTLRDFGEGITFVTFDDADGHGDHTQLTITSEVTVDTANQGAPTYSTNGKINKFGVKFFEMVTLNFDSFIFSSASGTSTKCHLQPAAPPDTIVLGNDLSFIYQIEQALQSFTGPDSGMIPRIDGSVFKLESNIGFDDFPVGSFSIFNFRLGTIVSLSLTTGKLGFEFSLGRPESPIGAIITPFLGQGYMLLGVDTEPSHSFEFSIAAGLAIEISFLSVISGVVKAGAGFAVGVQSSPNGPIWKVVGYFFLSGSASALGWLRVYVGVQLTLTYSGDVNGNSLVGSARYVADISMFLFNFHFETTISRTLQNSRRTDQNGGNAAIDNLGAHEITMAAVVESTDMNVDQHANFDLDWERYCSAFAPIPI